MKWVTHPRTCQCGGDGYVERGPSGATYSYPCYPWDCQTPDCACKVPVLATAEIPIRPTGELDEQGDPIARRVMTEQEIRERDVLNRDNTAPRLRARVLAAGNGRAG